MNISVQRTKAQKIKEFKVQRDEHDIPMVLLDGVEFPAAGLLGFSVDVDASEDPVVTLKISVERVTLDDYVSVWRTMESAAPAGTDAAGNRVKCPACGKMVRDGNFCTRCGSKLVEHPDIKSY